MGQRVVSLCWLIFIVYWFANALSVKSTAEKQHWGSRLAHRVPVWTGIVLLFVVGRSRPSFFAHAPFVPVLGAAICVTGLAAAIWSRRTIASNWSSDVEFKQDHKLITCGPYRFVRHPIYTSILIMCLGTAIVDENPAAGMLGVICFFVGFWIKLRQEERLMERHFPDEYPGYKVRVKALVPYVL